MEILELENKLSCFDLKKRNKALILLNEKIQSGEVKINPPKEIVNLHMHSFFSFNAYGYSPSHLVWEAKKRGIKICGIVDFDVLDGILEFLSAGDILGVRTVGSFETRVYIDEYKDKVINSPKGHGIAYFMGIGFTYIPDTNSDEGKLLSKFKEHAQERNKKMLINLNKYLNEISIDFERDIIPLTPSANPTERHILFAYDNKSLKVFTNRKEYISFWAKKLSVSVDVISEIVDNKSKFYNTIREKLMKLEGVGYGIQKRSFPSVESAIEFSRKCNAIPAYAWLDGSSESEANINILLQFLLDKGICAINIIPDRNWNLKDKNEKTRKVKKLLEVVKTAKKFELPISVGTEMNSYGQKFVDDFFTPEMLSVSGLMQEGAFIIYGHSLLERYLSYGYMSDWAKYNFKNIREKNRFYEKAGRIAGGMKNLEKLKKLHNDISPKEVLKLL